MELQVMQFLVIGNLQFLRPERNDLGGEEQ